MTSVAPLRDGEDRDLECLRPSKMQRISREDDQPPKFPGPWKMIQKKGVNFLDDRFRLRKVREVKRVETDSNKQKLWEKTFDRLVEYIARYGDSNVPVYFKDRELVAWVAEQRQDYLNGSLPSASLARLKELDFEFHATNYKTTEDHVLAPEGSNTSEARNQAAVGLSVVAQSDAANRRYERFGMNSSIKNPYTKPGPRFTREDPLSQELQPISRFKSTPKGQAGVSSNLASARLPTIAASTRGTLPANSVAATSSPKTILDKLRPHPPTPEIIENPPYRKDAQGGAAVVSPRDELTKEAALEVIENTDNTSTLSNDGDDYQEPFAADCETDGDSFRDEINGAGVFARSVDILRKSGMAFLLCLRKGGSNLVLHLILILHALGASIGLLKTMGTMGCPGDISRTEDITAHSKDGEDSGPLASNQDVAEDSSTGERLGGKILSYSADILRKSGMVFLFCLRQGGSILLFFLVSMIYALGFSAGVGIVMGYLILLGKIDVPAINDALGVCAVQ